MGDVIDLKRQRVIRDFENKKEVYKEFETDIINALIYLPEQNRLNVVVFCLQHLVTFKAIREHLQGGKKLNFKKRR